MFIEKDLIEKGVDLKIDDRLIAIYNKKWEDVVNDWNFSRFEPNINEHIPITIDRNGSIIHLEIIKSAPSLDNQINKIVNIIISLCCIITGYKLSSKSFYEGIAPSGIGILWFGVGVVVGLHLFAGQGAVRLLITLEWIMITFLSPYFTIMHLFFPYRPESIFNIRKFENKGIYIFFTMNVFLLIFIWDYKENLLSIVAKLNIILPVFLLISFILSTLILFKAYKINNISHIRRQIRILISTYCMVICLWIVFLITPMYIFETPITSQINHIATILIPMSYMISGTAPDLYRFDKLFLIILSYIISFSIDIIFNITLFNILNKPIHENHIAASICIILLFHPILLLVRKYIPILKKENDYKYFNQAIIDLSKTLESDQLTRPIVTSLGKVFNNPSMGIYLRREIDDELLNCVYNDRMPNIPEKINLKDLNIFDDNADIMKILDFRNKIQRDISNNNNYASMLLYDPQITLLCPIYHPQYKLLGLIAVGRRNDLDPYRLQDIEELQKLINASSMAYGNSYLYTQKSIAERTVRELFSSLKNIQDITAKKIAREIHDEIINVNIKLNIETIQNLVGYIDDQFILDQLDLLLTGEKDTAYSLRMICESLHPSGIDDPLGFIPVLSNQIDQIRCIYKGIIDIVVINKIIPISTSIQHEIIRVVKEAVLNSIKHANATTITIEICYPNSNNSALRVIISDNGSPKQPVLNRPGHFGIRNMKERIYMIGGRIEIQSDINTGTRVSIFVPLNSGVSVEQPDLLGIYC